MAKKWETLRATIKPLSPEQAAEAEQEHQAMRDAVALGQLREHCEQTEHNVTEESADVPPQVSRIQHSENTYLSALREWVEMLGGELELAAVFPDTRVIFSPPPTAEGDQGESGPEQAQPPA